MEEHNEPTTKSKKKMKPNLNSKLLPWILLVIILGGSIGATLYYKNRAEKVEADPTSVQKEKNQAETDRVVTSLKTVILISETEAPTVARVEEPEKLQKSNAEFYKNVQKGDYLIIYPKRAIIFRESENKIINVAPIINTKDLEKKKAESSEQPAAEDNSNSDNQ